MTQLKTNDDAANPKYFGVSEVANMFGVSADTIRHYESRGVFTAIRITRRQDRLLDNHMVSAIAKHRQRLKRGRKIKA